MAMKYYIVKNRSVSRVVYQIPEDHIRRVFAPGESKKISYDELVKLSYQPGGREMMTNFLQIVDEVIIKDLNIPAQPEYFLDEAQVVDLLKNGSLEQFLDCLDFAPVGVLELIQKQAVRLPLSDYAKRKALQEKTGFNVDQILKNLESERTEEGNSTSTNTTASSATTPAGRRTTPQYNVVKKADEDK